LSTHFYWCYVNFLFSGNKIMIWFLVNIISRDKRESMKMKWKLVKKSKILELNVFFCSSFIRTKKTLYKYWLMRESWIGYWIGWWKKTKTFFLVSCWMRGKLLSNNSMLSMFFKRETKKERNRMLFYI